MTWLLRLRLDRDVLGTSLWHSQTLVLPLAGGRAGPVPFQRSDTGPDHLHVAAVDVPARPEPAPESSWPSHDGPCASAAHHDEEVSPPSGTAGSGPCSRRALRLVD